MDIRIRRAVTIWGTTISRSSVRILILAMQASFPAGCREESWTGSDFAGERPRRRASEPASKKPLGHRSASSDWAERALPTRVLLKLRLTLQSLGHRRLNSGGLVSSQLGGLKPLDILVLP